MTFSLPPHENKMIGNAVHIATHIVFTHSSGGYGSSTDMFDASVKYSFDARNDARLMKSAKETPPATMTPAPAAPRTSADAIRVWSFPALTLGLTIVTPWWTRGLMGGMGGRGGRARGASVVRSVGGREIDSVVATRDRSSREEVRDHRAFEDDDGRDGRDGTARMTHRRAPRRVAAVDRPRGGVRDAASAVASRLESARAGGVRARRRRVTAFPPARAASVARVPRARERAIAAALPSFRASRDAARRRRSRDAARVRDPSRRRGARRDARRAQRRESRHP